MLKNIFVVGSSHAFIYANTFLRGVFLARILGPHDYGLALILISITGALDLFADAGIDRFVVQSRFGHRSDLMRTAHAFRVGGSAVVGLAIVLLSYPVSRAFDAPELWLPIALTGGIVTIRGFVNLSYKLQQREHRFGREAGIQATIYTVELLATTLVALWTKSYWAVLVGAYLNAITQIVLSHMLANGKYSFIPRGKLVGLVSRFSLPIYMNAALLLASAQGDRLVIAASFSKTQLAFYAAASAIGAGVTGLAGSMTMNIMLPRLAPRDGGPGLSRRHINQITALFIGGSLVFLAAITLAGPTLVGLLYGPAFVGLGTLVFAAAIAQMIQLEQSWLTTLLMANGLTARFPMITIMRAAAFPTALVLVSLGFSILAVPLAFAFGATLSLAVSYHAASGLKLIDGRLIVVSFARVLLASAAVLLLARSWAVA
ncbi:oligosaccharide flippase family protein [Phenylobacterium sp.]|uniref:oligosaccharide flippase family protein n=1 Tax=Phenylobacterium sp. TaxID=1871053 RepID=UPI0025EC3472|nr:oligosaccharide flippase family protein [Phenylobacterium sp.]